MEGILVVDKPQGFTSFDVVAKLRGMCGTRKIGHGGTLDPMATGVLPVFVERVAKAVDLQPRQDKIYEAVLLLGTGTDTGDITGNVVATAPVAVGEKEVLAVLPRFVGLQKQVPPMVSAIKVNGKPLYKYAREGKEIERKARDITIFSIEYLGRRSEQEYVVQVHCSKGTYIRTLAEDIGTALGVPATLAALRRTAAGVFDIEQAHTLEELQKAADEGKLPDLMLGVETVFEGLPRLELERRAVRALQNGAPGYEMPQAKKGRYTAYCGNVFVGLVQVNTEGKLRGEKIFLPREETGE
jgi:tRNA pseudouridine55 synthase